jgi:hypothetical protein
MQKFTGMQYLAIDIASNYGLDKKTWDERLAWFEQHRDCLHEMLATAETPALYYAGVKAYEAALAGQPSGYPVSLDATSSGLQILAAVTGDRKAAELCNVVNSMEEYLDTVTNVVMERIARADAYTGVYGAMVEKIGEEGKIKREDTKQAIMTSLYGSKAVPKEVFGEGILLQIFYDTMAELAPAAWELNQVFLDIWNPEALVNSWVLPDNFHVHVKVMSQVKETVHFLNEPFDTFRKVNAPVDEGRSLGANTIHSLDGMIVREMNRRCNYSKQRINDLKMMFAGKKHITTTESDNEMVSILWGLYEQSGYLSARILDHLGNDNFGVVNSLDIARLIESLPEKPFQIMTIHDCFRCLPNYANDLREQYNLQLTLIARSNILDFLLSQLVGRSVECGKVDDTLWQDIQHAEYALS